MPERKPFRKKPTPEPTSEPQRRRRRTQTGPAVPYWKAAGGGPLSARYAEETEPTEEEQTDASE